MPGFFGIRRRKPFHCDVCNQKSEDLQSMEEHRCQVHKDAVPNAKNGK